MFDHFVLVIVTNLFSILLRLSRTIELICQPLWPDNQFELRMKVQLEEHQFGSPMYSCCIAVDEVFLAFVGL
jgi:hypothetical protein